MIPVDIDNFIMDSINYRLGKHIRIYGNFNKIPKEIGNCSSLIYIYFCYNKIVDITALTNLTSLEYLILENNQIVDISALANLTSLKYLCLENNKIKNRIKFKRDVLVYY